MSIYTWAPCDLLWVHVFSLSTHSLLIQVLMIFLTKKEVIQASTNASSRHPSQLSYPQTTNIFLKRTCTSQVYTTPPRPLLPTQSTALHHQNAFFEHHKALSRRSHLPLRCNPNSRRRSHGRGWSDPSCCSKVSH